MTVNHKRPINLDLGSFSYPAMAIASILHRISGLVLFILLPLMMWFLSASLSSPLSFDRLQIELANPCYKFLLWAFSTALIYHLIAGIRHILLDIGIGEHVAMARRTAITVIVLALISAIFLGIWIC